MSLLRRPARDQAHRIGSLFLNPGGPGGSGIAWANYAPNYLSPVLLDRFDVVGVDPRGVNLSDQVKCFTSTDQQTQALKGFDLVFPMGKVEERAFTASATSLGEGCSSTGRPLSGSLSTAEVARDMDVLRRAVGDRKLTFFGISYGSYLGQVYANMFPDRVRAVTIDGVVDRSRGPVRPPPHRVRPSTGCAQLTLRPRRCARSSRCATVLANRSAGSPPGIRWPTTTSWRTG